MEAALQAAAWIIGLLLLGFCWPIAQSLRHENLSPLAAYLLFTSVLVLVAAALFLVLIRVMAAVLPSGVLESPAVAILVMLLALVPAFAAARWILRRPQQRRMPR